MVDYLHLAIADCLRHPKLGIVSHQPGFGEPISNEISVRDSNFVLYHGVLASDCEDVSAEERDEYWRKVNEIIDSKNKNEEEKLPAQNPY